MNISDLRNRFELAKMQADAAVNMRGQEGIRRMEEARRVLQPILLDVSNGMKEIDVELSRKKTNTWDIPEKRELKEKERVRSSIIADQKIMDKTEKKRGDRIGSAFSLCIVAVLSFIKIGFIGGIILFILQVVFLIMGLFSGNFRRVEQVSNTAVGVFSTADGLITVAVIAVLIGTIVYWLFSKAKSHKQKEKQNSKFRSIEQEIAALQSTIAAKEQEIKRHNERLEQESGQIRSEWMALHREIGAVLSRISRRIEEENRIINKSRFDDGVTSYKNAALNNSEALSSLVRYMAELYERSMGVYRLQAYEKELRCLFSFTVQKDRIVFDRPRNKQQSEQDDTYYFKNQRKKELQSIQEQYGLAWALSVLLENEMRMRYPQGTIEIIQRKEADVMMVFSIKNPEYQDEQPLF